ncbi:hypothetical protein NPIL_132321 [Nephila pilipes]|uniref:Uncharacterized protein n=1 Tax=Nephila pilipes TaxID=299642 RepID=A0A8X6PA26_NEPPI|nr:hypothetical protein NPIL_132321 [Nephila pilipes]
MSVRGRGFPEPWLMSGACVLYHFSVVRHPQEWSLAGLAFRRHLYRPRSGPVCGMCRRIEQERIESRGPRGDAERGENDPPRPQRNTNGGDRVQSAKDGGVLIAYVCRNMGKTKTDTWRLDVWSEGWRSRVTVGGPKVTEMYVSQWKKLLRGGFQEKEKVLQTVWVPKRMKTNI